MIKDLLKLDLLSKSVEGKTGSQVVGPLTLKMCVSTYTNYVLNITSGCILSCINLNLGALFLLISYYTSCNNLLYKILRLG